jgi:hypothetical protein
VTDSGDISEFKGSQKSENLRCFLDRLKNHEPNFIGTLKPKQVSGIQENAQWLSGIAAGAWFELYKTETNTEFRFRRISPYGNIDVDAIFIIEDEDASFNYDLQYEFVHYSNCKFFNIKQGDRVFRFNKK